jgi:hypothetical protein
MRIFIWLRKRYYKWRYERAMRRFVKNWERQRELIVAPFISVMTDAVKHLCEELEKINERN